MVPGGVLASFQGSTYQIMYASPSHLLRPCRTTVLSILHHNQQLNMAPSFVLTSKESSTYRKGYASGSFFSAALLDGHGELPDSRYRLGPGRRSRFIPGLDVPDNVRLGSFLPCGLIG